MRPNKPLVLFWFCALGLCFSSAAQTVLHVVDADGRGIPGAAIVGPEGSGFVTDRAGALVLPDSVDLQSGHVWVLQCLGFENRMLQASDLEQGTTFRLEEAILDLPQALVEAVSLTGGRPMGVPGAVTVLSARALQRQGAVDVHRILRNVPGVYVQEEDGFGLRPNIGLRGSGSERSSRISLLEDGIPIAPAAYTAPSAYYFPSVGRMSGIEVMKGSSQIAYGPNTLGGAINLISTPIPETLAGRVDGRLGSFGTGRLHVHVGDGSGRVGWMLEALQAGSDGFKIMDGGGPTGYGKLDLLGKLRLRSREGARLDQRLELKLGRVQESSNETYAGLLLADFEVEPYRRYLGSQNDHMEASQRQVVLTHNLRLGRGWRLTNRLYATRFDRNWYKVDQVAGSGGQWVKLGTLLADAGLDSDGTAALAVFKEGTEGTVRLKNNNRAYGSHGISMQWVWEGQEWGWQRFESAVRIQEDGMDRFQWTDDWTMDFGRLINPQLGTPGEESNRIEWSRAAAGYAQARWSRGGWTWIPGIRLESILAERGDYGTQDVGRAGTQLQTRRHRSWALLPGCGVRKALGSEWSAFAGIHRGFIPPGSAEDVEPEFAWNSELGLRFVRAKAEATLVGFGHFGRNLQGSDFASSGGSGDGEVFNGGSTRVFGVEASASLTNGIRPEEGHRFELGVTYTFTDGRFTSSFESQYGAWGEVSEGDFLPYMSRQQGALRLGWSRTAWSMDASMGFVEGMRTMAGNEPLKEIFTVGGNTVLDATLRRTLGKGFSLELGARNLLDTVYIASARPAGLRPGMPRTVTGGFNLSF